MVADRSRTCIQFQKRQWSEMSFPKHILLSNELMGGVGVRDTQQPEYPQKWFEKIGADAV